MVQHAEEVASGQRFEFGANWARFLDKLDEDRIAAAVRSLAHMLGMESLHGRSFVDIGSGSGLFSLAARRLGASVHSFDFDPQSVACTNELRRRFFPNDPHWTVEAGSILDRDYLGRLGAFDIVYSWGVLHHTGRMWDAIENAARLVGPGGSAFIAIYNDQGRASRYWLWIKQAYNRLPRGLRWLVLVPAAIRLRGPSYLRRFVRGLLGRKEAATSRGRGMDAWRDVIDWVGGLPFEVATPEQIFDFFRARGFVLQRLTTCAGGHGCNEFVFVRGPA